MSGTEPSAAQSHPIPPKEKALEGILGLAFAGSFEAGDKLPGERALCERLGVSRTALRSAIKQLISQGILESRHGSGTYLRRSKPTQVFQESGSFTDIVEATGRVAGSRTLHARESRADDLIAEKMGIAPDSPIYVIERVRLADGVPIAIQTSYIDMGHCPGIADHDFDTESLMHVMKGAYGIRRTGGMQRISITRVDEREARLLEVDRGTPAFFEQCFNQDENHRTIEYCRSVTLANHFQYANDDTGDGVANEKVQKWLWS